MVRVRFSLLTLAVAAKILTAQNGGRPEHNEADRLARWKRVDMPFHSTSLTANERQVVEKLVEACRLLNDIYWRQSDFGALTIYKTTANPTLKRLFSIMGSRWDLLDENRPFLGEQPLIPGHELYPHDLTLAEIQKLPEQKDAIYNQFTVVKREGNKLVAVPYHEQYKEFLVPAAKALRDAAALTPDKAFAGYLQLRAEALLSDDYYASDIAWLALADPKIDLIYAPYETYLDDLLGVKTSYGASILIRNEEESAKLALYRKYVPDIQDALPLDAADRPSKRGHLTPMEVMDAPYRAGDLRYGYQAVADNLPNDPRVHQEKGSKKIFFKNFMDARVTYVILPIAQKLMHNKQAALASGEGYLAGTVMHEIAHELGPNFSRRDGKQLPITEAIGPAYSGLEEAKADVTGMFGLAWLAEHDAIPKSQLPGDYSSYLAGIFRTLRFGTGEAHGRAELMEFNYLLEQKGINRNSQGQYSVDFARIPAVLAGLCKELLTMEATGDRPRVEAWFKKYNVVPADLQASLAATKDIPVDIEPVFSFPDQVK